MGILAFDPAAKAATRDIAAVILDWAGTTIDFGSLAPVYVFREIFQRSGIEVTEAEAREPMGQAKIDHIRSMFQTERIAALWKDRYGRMPSEVDVEDLYADFLPLQKQVLAQYAQVIPGVPEAVLFLRARGIKIGSTTGYTRELMDVVEPLVAEQGYAPEVTVCSDEVAAGRPAPWQNYRAAEKLGVYPMQRILVVDDSVAGIEAGRHAGCWTIAIAGTGNAMGCTLDAYRELHPDERTICLNRIRDAFVANGAQIVLESLADLPSICE
jgi:phosphonoacetaldehyde hydrolase